MVWKKSDQYIKNYFNYENSAMAYSISFYNYNTQINWIFQQFVHDELVSGKLEVDVRSSNIPSYLFTYLHSY